MTTLYALAAGGITTAALAPIAIAGWHRLIDWADEHTQRPSNQPIGTHRPAIGRARVALAAITAEPHREINDPHLGVIRIAGQVPAHLYNALAASVNTVNTRSVR